MMRLLLAIGVPFSLGMIVLFSAFSLSMIAFGNRRIDIEFLYVEDNSDSDIFLYDTFTGLRLNLTNQAIGASFARWSPDGERILFEALQESTSADRWYAMTATGANIESYLGGIFSLGDSSVTPSPDGTQVAFASTRTGNYDIFIYDTETRRSRRITTDDARDITPAWSPDGTRLAFSSDRDGNDAEIFVYDLATETMSVITDNWVFDYGPVWIDDARIVYASSRDGLISLFLYDLNTGTERPLTPHFFWSAMPHSTGDGRLIFSGQFRFGDLVQVYLIDADQNTIQKLTRDEGNFFNPAWRP